MRAHTQSCTHAHTRAHTQSCTHTIMHTRQKHTGTCTPRIHGHTPRQTHTQTDTHPVTQSTWQKRTEEEKTRQSLTWHRPFPAGSSRTHSSEQSAGRSAVHSQGEADLQSSHPSTRHTARTTERGEGEGEREREEESMGVAGEYTNSTFERERGDRWREEKARERGGERREERGGEKRGERRGEMEKERMKREERGKTKQERGGENE